MCQALLALEIEELNKVDKSVCPCGDYLLGVGDSVKVLLMLTGEIELEGKRIQLERGGRLQLQFVGLRREGSNEKSHTGKDLKEVRE